MVRTLAGLSIAAALLAPSRADAQDDAAPPFIPAYGTCTRPTDAEQAALTTQVRAWIARHVHGKLVADDQPDLQFGCVEARGIVIDAQIDVTHGTGQSGYWWVLRVGGKSIQALASVRSTAKGDWSEDAPEDTIDTVGLVDLDGDQRLDPVIEREQRYGGDPTSSYTVKVALGNRAVTVGTVRDVTLDDAGADPSGLALTFGTKEQVETKYCISGAKRWKKCPK